MGTWQQGGPREPFLVEFAAALVGRGTIGAPVIHAGGIAADLAGPAVRVGRAFFGSLCPVCPGLPARSRSVPFQPVDAEFPQRGAARDRLRHALR